MHRGISNEELAAGCHGTMEELTDWTLWADRALTV